MIAQVSIQPRDNQPDRESVATVVRILEKRGITHEVGPMGTSVEGDWDEVLDAVKACRDELLQEQKELHIELTIDDGPEVIHSLEDRKRSVQQAR